MAEHIELLPCPFCGGKAEVQQTGTVRRSTIYACTYCGCRLETGEVFNIGRTWNQRFPDTASARENGR